jgi:hypothetical protein
MSPPESDHSNNPNNANSAHNGWERFFGHLGAALFVLLCVEIGLFLLVLPWSSVWEKNLILRYYPRLKPFVMSAFLKGAISGLGVVNLGLGVLQAWNFRRPISTPPTPN